MGKHDGRVVCIVDDDPSLRRSLRNLLMSVGFRVETFDSAEAFLESAHRHGIGCVVLDVRMAGMSGVDLLRHLVATGSRIPAIMLTAHADDETRRHPVLVEHRRHVPDHLGQLVVGHLRRAVRAPEAPHVRHDHAEP